MKLNQKIKQGGRARRWLVLPALALVGLVAAACADDGAAASADPQERTFALHAVQHAMDRHVDRTPFPDTLEQHPEITEHTGFRLDEPDEEGNWYARSYYWAGDTTMVVNQGDTVTIDVFGIHGDSHPAVIEGYDVTFEARRGEYSQVTFTADEPGIFNIFCVPHPKTMTATLVVLPS